MNAMMNPNKVKKYQLKGARCAAMAQEYLTLLLQNYSDRSYHQAIYSQLQARFWYRAAQEVAGGKPYELLFGEQTNEGK